MSLNAPQSQPMIDEEKGAEENKNPLSAIEEDKKQKEKVPPAFAPLEIPSVWKDHLFTKIQITSPGKPIRKAGEGYYCLDKYLSGDPKDEKDLAGSTIEKVRSEDPSAKMTVVILGALVSDKEQKEKFAVKKIINGSSMAAVKTRITNVMDIYKDWNTPGTLVDSR